MILCARCTARSREHFFWEIHAVRKGMWGFSWMLIGWAAHYYYETIFVTIPLAKQCSQTTRKRPTESKVKGKRTGLLFVSSETFQRDFSPKGSHTYNPFGRPGAGAPIKDREGNVVTQTAGKVNHDVLVSCVTPLEVGVVSNPLSWLVILVALFTPRCPTRAHDFPSEFLLFWSVCQFLLLLFPLIVLFSFPGKFTNWYQGLSGKTRVPENITYVVSETL